MFASASLSISSVFGENGTTNGQPSVFLPKDNHEFSQVVEGTQVLHDFIVQNKGTADLNIKKVKPG